MKGRGVMKTKEELPACPVATTVQLVGSKWKLLILRNLLARPWRFQRSIWGPFSLEKNFNLIPFKNIVNSSSLYNIILTVPFGFLLPFICRMNLLKLLLAGIGFSGILELLQALAGILAGYSTRVIDINDLICNTAGAAAGYGLFLILYMAVRKISEKKASVNFLFTYIIERK